MNLVIVDPFQVWAPQNRIDAEQIDKRMSLNAKVVILILTQEADSRQLNLITEIIFI